MLAAVVVDGHRAGPEHRVAPFESVARRGVYHRRVAVNDNEVQRDEAVAADEVGDMVRVAARSAVGAVAPEVGTAGGDIAVRRRAVAQVQREHLGAVAPLMVGGLEGGDAVTRQQVRMPCQRVAGRAVYAHHAATAYDEVEHAVARASFRRGAHSLAVGAAGGEEAVVPTVEVALRGAAPQLFAAVHGQMQAVAAVAPVGGAHHVGVVARSGVALAVPDDAVAHRRGAVSHHAALDDYVHVHVAVASRAVGQRCACVVLRLAEVDAVVHQPVARHQSVIHLRVALYHYTHAYRAVAAVGIGAEHYGAVRSGGVRVVAIPEVLARRGVYLPQVGARYGDACHDDAVAPLGVDQRVFCPFRRAVVHLSLPLHAVAHHRVEAYAVGRLALRHGRLWLDGVAGAVRGDGEVQHVEAVAALGGEQRVVVGAGVRQAVAMPEQHAVHGHALLHAVFRQHADQQYAQRVGDAALVHAAAGEEEGGFYGARVKLHVAVGGHGASADHGAVEHKAVTDGVERRGLHAVAEAEYHGVDAVAPVGGAQ